MTSTGAGVVDNNRLRRLATYASVSVAGLLIAAKLSAYFMTDSVAMLSSLLDSTVDFIASAITVYGVSHALRPPDHNHRFGHGKAEPLTALAQAAFIVGSSILLGYEALGRLYHPHQIQNETFGYFVMVGASLLTVVLIEFQRFVIRRTSSMAIDADRLHYVGDLIINIAVIAAFALHQLTDISWLDPVFAVLISAGLIVGASRIAFKALRILMDEELPDEDRRKIREIVEAVPSVRGMHDLRTRSDSDRQFIQLHIELDGTLSLLEAHDVAENVMEAIRKQYPDADVMVHNDPVGIEEARLDTQIAERAPS